MVIKNLNLPRYIASQQAEDLRGIAGHLKRGIPVGDIDALQGYGDVCPKLRRTLFKSNRSGYVDVAVDKAAIDEMDRIRQALTRRVKELAERYETSMPHPFGFT